MSEDNDSAFKGIPSGIADHGPLQKQNPVLKFNVQVKNPFLTNLRVLISNRTRYF